MATHTLHVENWRPCGLNALMASVQSRIKAKKLDRQMVKAYAVVQQIPKANCRRRVWVEIGYCGRQKQYDADNLTKSLLDALVQAQLLIDDSPTFLVWSGVEQVRGESTYTRVTLEDC